jgi:hypothetical protein
VQRGAHLFPKQGLKAPWILPQNYLIDLLNLHFGAVDDGTLMFSGKNDGTTTAHRFHHEVVKAEG